MIRLHDTDGRAILLQEHFIVAVVPYQFDPDEAAEYSGRRKPESLVLCGDKGFAVIESVDDIDTKIRLGDFPGETDRRVEV